MILHWTQHKNSPVSHAELGETQHLAPWYFRRANPLQTFRLRERVCNRVAAPNVFQSVWKRLSPLMWCWYEMSSHRLFIVLLNPHEQVSRQQRAQTDCCCVETHHSLFKVTWSDCSLFRKIWLSETLLINYLEKKETCYTHTYTVCLFSF